MIYPRSASQQVLLKTSDYNRKRLWTGVQLALLLHGNASVEGGFSVDKKLRIENMLEETVVAQRVMYYTISTAGKDVENVPC